MKGKKLCSILAALCLSVVGALPVSAAARSQNAAVFEAEKYTFYYPASDAQLLHDGHGNFTVSDSSSGAISSDDFFTTVITPETGSGGLAINSPLTGSVENQLTLVTCLANQPNVRLIVMAEQVV